MSQRTLKEAKEFLNAKAYGKAIEVCSEILMWNSANYHAHVFMGLASQNLRKWEDSEKSYKKAIELEKENILAYQGLISLYESWDKPEAAIEPIKLAMEMTSEVKKHFDLNLKLIKCLKDSHKDLDAISILEGLLFDSKVKSFYGEELADKHDSLLLELIKTIEKFEEVHNKKEVESRRYKISAPPLKEVIRQVEEEIILQSKLPSYYQMYLEGYESMDLASQSETVHRLRISFVRYLFRKIPFLDDESQKEASYVRMISLCKAWRQHVKVWDPKPAEVLLDFEDLSEEEEYDSELVDLYLKYESEEGAFHSILLGYRHWTLKEIEESRSFLEDGLKRYKSSVVGLRTLVRLEKLENSVESCLSASIKLNQSMKKLNSRFSVKFKRSFRDCKLNMANSYFSIDYKYFANALELYLDIVNVDENDAEGLEGLCLVYGAMGKAKESVEYGHRVLQRRPSSHKCTSEVSWQLYILNQMESSLEMAIKAIELEPDIALYHYRLGCVYWKLEGKYRSETDFAYASFLACVKLDPLFSKAFTKLGTYYLIVEGDRVRALKCYQKAFGVDNSDEEAALELTRLIAGEVDNTVAILEALVKARPRCFWAWRKLGFLQITSRRHSDSVISFQTALRISSLDVPCWEGLGESYMKTGKYLAALKAFQKASEVNPDSKTSKFFIGICQKVLELYDESIQTFSRLIALENEDSSIMIAARKQLCETLMAQLKSLKVCGYYGRAASNCFKIIKVSCQVLKGESSIRLTFWKIMSDAFMELYDIQIYEKHAPCDLKEELLSVISETVDSELGFENEDRNDWASMAIQCTKMCVLIALDSGIKCHAEWYALSLLLYRQYKHGFGDRYLSQSLRCIRCSLEINPESFVYWHFLGVYTMSFDYMLSQHCFVKAIELSNGRDAQSWVNLGFLYLKNNLVELSNKCFSNAQACDPDNLSAWMGQAVIAEHYDYKEFLGLMDHAFDMTLGVHSEVNRLYALHKFRQWIQSKSFDSELVGNIRFALEKYLEIDESDPYACFLLALVYEKVKKIDSAFELIERANKCASTRLMKYVSGMDSHKTTQARNLLDSIKQNNIRILVLSKNYEAAIDALHSVNDLSSNAFYQLLLSVCYLKQRKFDLCLKCLEDVLGNSLSTLSQKDFAWYFQAQCYHFMSNKSMELEQLLISWKNVIPDSDNLLEMECAFGALYEKPELFKNSLDRMKQLDYDRTSIRGRFGLLLNAGFQLCKAAHEGKIFSSILVRRAPGCPSSWAVFARSVLEGDSSYAVEGKKAILSAIKLYHEAGDESFQFDVMEYYETLNEAYLSGGSEDPEEGVKAAMLYVRLNPSSVRARLALVLAFRYQISMQSDLTKGTMRRYKALLDGMKVVVVGNKGASKSREESALLKLLQIDLIILNSRVFIEDEAKSRDHLVRAFKETDKFIKTSNGTSSLGFGYWFMGRVLMNLGELEKAIIAYKNSIQYLGDNIILWMEFWDILSQVGYGEASQWVEERLQTLVKPSKAVSFLCLAKRALRLMYLGDFQHAYEVLSAARVEYNHLEQISVDRKNFQQFEQIIGILGKFIKSKKAPPTMI